LILVEANVFKIIIVEKSMNDTTTVETKIDSSIEQKSGGKKDWEDPELLLLSTDNTQAGGGPGNDGLLPYS
jgi:hypothetical protein